MATPEKKISGFPEVTAIAETDIFLGNAAGSTSQIPVDAARTRLNTGNQTVTGQVTATQFNGSGSGLTEVIKTTGDQSIAGDLAVTAITGDGSGLTGIAAGTGGVENTGSTTIGADTNDSDVGEIALQTKGVTRQKVTNSGDFDILDSDILKNGESWLPDGAIGRVNMPLLDYDLSHDTRKIVRGEGSDTFTRSTVQNIFDRYGIVSEIAIDNSGAEKNGTKVEGPGTNQLIYAADHSNAAWVKSAAPSSTTETDPEGGSTAYKVTGITPGDGNIVTQTISYDFTDDLSASSFFIKGVLGETIKLDLRNGGAEIVGTDTHTFNGKWERGKNIVDTSGATNNNWTLSLRVDAAQTATEVTYWGGQLEHNDIVTSLMKSVAAPLPRTVNLASLPYAENFPAPADDMTIIIDFSIDGIVNANDYLFFIVGETNRAITFQKSSGKISVFHGSSRTFSTTVLTNYQMYRVACVNDGTDLLLYLDGIFESSITQEVVGGVATGAAVIGASGISGANPMYGNIKNIRVYDRALTASEVRTA